jgi:hypothetical protein
MGIASRRKKERKLQDNVTITESNNSFFDYLINANLSSDLIPITDELINELMDKNNMSKDYLLTMKKQGYKYSLSRGSFLMLDN